MGHSSINVTLDRYGHLLPELDEAIAIGFGERIAAARTFRHERLQVLVQGPSSGIASDGTRIGARGDAGRAR
jgi:hypothetical protein